MVKKITQHLHAAYPGILSNSFFMQSSCFSFSNN